MTHSSNFENFPQKFCETLNFIHQRGWAPGTGGNFSYVYSRVPLVLKMAPSGVDKGAVLPKELISVNEIGQIIQGKGNASAEALLHVCVARSVNAEVIFHTHSIFNTILSERYASLGHLTIEGYEMLKGLRGITTHDCQIDIPVYQNSQDIQGLSKRIESHLSSKEAFLPCFLLAGHGLYVWGSSIFEAKRHLEILEFLFEVMYHKLLLPDLSSPH